MSAGQPHVTPGRKFGKLSSKCYILELFYFGSTTEKKIAFWGPNVTFSNFCDFSTFLRSTGNTHFTPLGENFGKIGVKSYIL